MTDPQTAPRWTTEQIETALLAALKERDMPACVSLLRLLAVSAPDRAELILTRIRLREKGFLVDVSGA